MKKIKKIGVLTSGGDAPGLNAVIRAAVITATRQYGWEVVGINNGFEGLLQDSQDHVPAVNSATALYFIFWGNYE